MTSSSPPPLIGRDVHLQHGLQALDALAGGRGGLLHLNGEAGTGKSRLAQAVADAATDRGLPVAWGRPSAGGPADNPFGAWTRALQRLGSAPTWPPGAAVGLDQAAALVRRAAADAPVVLVLDDLHRADDCSRWLVGHLLDDLLATPVLLVVATRPVDGPVGEEQDRWRHHRACTRVRLDALDAPDVAALLAALTGEGIDVGHPLVTFAEGSPAEAVALAETWGGTAGRAAVLQRIADLVAAHDDGGVLAVLAALERPCTPDFLGNAKTTTIAAIARQPVDAVLGRLHAAERAGIVRDEGGAQRWSLRHPLLGDAALADPVLAAGIRGRLGDALLAVEAEEGSGVVSAECAGQLILAGRPQPAITARAARWHLDTGQPRKALDLVVATVTTALPEEAQIHLNRLAGIAHGALGAHAEAEDYLTGTINRARARGMAEALAEAVTDLLVWVPTIPDRARVALIDDALAVVPGLPTATAARLEAAAAHALVHVDHPRATALWAQAAGRRDDGAGLPDGDVAVEAEVLALPAVHGCQADLDPLEDAVGVLSRLEQRHGRGRALAAVGGLSLALIRGTREEIDRALRRVDDALGDWPAPELAGYAAAARLALARCDADHAALQALAADPAWLQVPPRSHAAVLLGVGHLLWDQALGGLPPLPDAAARAARVDAPRSRRSMELTALGISALANADLRGDLRDRLDALAVDPDAVPRDFRWTGDLVALAAFAGAAGDVGLATRAADLLMPHLEEMAVVLPTGVSGPVGLHVAHARIAAGDVEGAALGVAAALRCCERTRSASWEALTRLLQARVELVAQRPSAAREALRRAAELVAGGAMPQVAEDLGRLEDQLAAVERAEGVRLSDREVEVLQLVAMGATNRQVARSLGISPKTVEYHLAGAFRSLGAANRTEAVELARRARLLR